MEMNIVNITSPINKQLQDTLSLAPGQIIKAQVIKTEGSQVLLQLGNNLLQAQTQVPLSIGDRLNLQVQSVQDNSIELKIVADTAALMPEEAVLAKLGFKPQNEMNIILQQLVRFNLPVSQNAITELYNAIKGHKFSEDPTQLMVWLATVGIKVDSEKDFTALESLRKFFKREISGDEEPQFFNFLNASENNIYGGYNIFGWPVAGHHIYLLSQESKHEKPQAENCTLVLQLNSRCFEELWFKIELVNHNLQATVLCNNDQYRTILAREVGRLGQALQAAGYKIGDIHVQVNAARQTILDFIPGESSRAFGINYQV